eukprot:CCRYP_003225-RA/>CCRYP_003225-RA protein AED:0.38 eAED:0.38 QI:0/0/0/1/0/0/3/0/295
MVNREQMTLTCHFHDLKVSHKDSFKLAKFIQYLAKIYGNQITINQGVYHDYLGMDLDYSLPGKVRVSMINYIDKILDDFPEAITKTNEVEKQGKFLCEEQARHFHHTVAQLLFISGRARRDIQTSVAFLTTCVKRLDKDDWGKLQRVLQYLLGTKHKIKWWVDASYNKHKDCRGQTGAMVSLGKGAVKKLNVRSSCEGELVGIDDAVSWIIWCKYFIEALGYMIEQNVLYQDNNQPSFWLPTDDGRVRNGQSISSQDIGWNKEIWRYSTCRPIKCGSTFLQSQNNVRPSRKCVVS